MFSVHEAPDDFERIEWRRCRAVCWSKTPYNELRITKFTSPITDQLNIEVAPAAGTGSSTSRQGRTPSEFASRQVPGRILM
jgi:hypothetical protein